MKKKVVLVIALTMCHLIVSAQDIINYFEVASNIAKPVTMKTAKERIKYMVVNVLTEISVGLRHTMPMAIGLSTIPPTKRK